MRRRSHRPARRAVYPSARSPRRRPARSPPPLSHTCQSRGGPGSPDDSDRDAAAIPSPGPSSRISISTISASAACSIASAAVPHVPITWWPRFSRRFRSGCGGDPIARPVEPYIHQHDLRVGGLLDRLRRCPTRANHVVAQVLQTIRDVVGDQPLVFHYQNLVSFFSCHIQEK